MKTSTGAWLVAIVLAIVIVGAWWYVVSYNKALQGPGEEKTATTTPQIPGDNLALGQNSNATIGSFLIAYNAMTLYTYLPDTVGLPPSCTGQCAVQWPPYVVTSTENLVAESPIAGTVSTIKRADGTNQLTYNGHPLYFYKGDVSPNDVNGEGLEGVWYVIKP